MSQKPSKGDGGSRKKDEGYDLEQQFVLRLPPGQAMALAHEIEVGGTLKDNLFIDINPESRWGTVRYGGEVINAKLVDLPCIIEALKTTDKKTFYKTADICQMLICSNEMEPSDEDVPSPKKKKDKEKKYHYPHGVTNPLKNVRKRRFRKTLKKRPIDLASIEKEVKRLLRMDIEAVDVKFEEIYEENADGSKGPVDESISRNNSTVDFVDAQEMFGDVSSSSDDGEVNIDDESDGENSTAGALTRKTQAIEEGEEVVLEKISALKKELKILNERIANQEVEIKSVDNADLKKRFKGILDDLYEERSEKQNELENLMN